MQYWWVQYVPLFTISFLGYSTLDPNSPDAATFTPTTDQVIYDLNQSKDE